MCVFITPLVSLSRSKFIRKIQVPACLLFSRSEQPAIIDSDEFINIPNPQNERLGSALYSHLHRVETHDATCCSVAIHSKLRVTYEVLMIREERHCLLKKRNHLLHTALRSASCFIVIDYEATGAPKCSVQEMVAFLEEAMSLFPNHQHLVSNTQF